LSSPACQNAMSCLSPTKRCVYKENERMVSSTVSKRSSGRHAIRANWIGPRNVECLTIGTLEGCRTNQIWFARQGDFECAEAKNSNVDFATSFVQFEDQARRQRMLTPQHSRQELPMNFGAQGAEVKCPCRPHRRSVGKVPDFELKQRHSGPGTASQLACSNDSGCQRVGA